MLYMDMMYTLMPHGAEIKLLFAVRQSVFEIRAYIHMRDLDVTLA